MSEEFSLVRVIRAAQRELGYRATLEQVKALVRERYPGEQWDEKVFDDTRAQVRKDIKREKLQRAAKEQQVARATSEGLNASLATLVTIKAELASAGLPLEKAVHEAELFKALSDKVGGFDNLLSVLKTLQNLLAVGFSLPGTSIVNGE